MSTITLCTVSFDDFGQSSITARTDVPAYITEQTRSQDSAVNEFKLDYDLRVFIKPHVLGSFDLLNDENLMFEQNGKLYRRVKVNTPLGFGGSRISIYELFLKEDR